MTIIDDLKTIALLQEKATKGPWRVCEGLLNGTVYRWHIASDKYGSSYPICDHVIEEKPDGSEQLTNAKFIAACGSFDFTALCDEMERMRDANQHRNI